MDRGRRGKYVQPQPLLGRMPSSIRRLGQAMGNTTVELQRWLDLLRSGDDRGRRELINHASERLQKLTRHMLKSFPSVHRWEESEDVRQNALLRLYRALADVHPESLRHFYNLAAMQIRRELLDLAKHHFGPEGQGARHHSDGGEAKGSQEQQPDTEGGPASLSEWTDFHEQVETLPDD